MVNAFRWMVFVIGLAVVIGSIMVTSAGNPIIVINNPSNGDTVYTDEITVSGSAMGTDGAVVESVKVNGGLADGTTSWRKDISLQPGLNVITVEAKDNMRQSSSKTIEVTYIEPNSTPTNESTPTPTTTTISNGGYRPTPAPTPTPTGSISITTKPSEAEIFWDGVSKGDTPITLEDIVGNHKIEISKEGYRSENRNIDLYERITKKLNIKLNPITGFIVVSSTPSGACVYLDGDYKGKTPRRISTVVGNHTIELTKSDYFDEVERVSVSDNNRTYLHVNLTGCGYINISSHPSGAKVYLDGNDTGETTPKNNCRVAVGKYNIKLTKLGYFDVIRPVAVSVGRTSPVHENLTECGSLYIFSYPSGANVSVDGIYMGKTPKNISTVVLGNHTIKITKFCYATVIRNVTVSVGEPFHLHENLTGYGSLCISSNPSGAKVYLNGDYKGKTLLENPKVIEGSYSLGLKKIGYGEVEKRIHVSAAELTLVDVTLSQSICVSVLLEFIPEIVVGIIIALSAVIILKVKWILEKLRKLVEILHEYIKKSRNTVKKYISERKKRNE